MSKPTTLRDLVALAELVTASVNAIVESCGGLDGSFPSPDDPFDLDSEAIRSRPDVQKHSTVLLAATTQLAATVRSPLSSLIIHAFSVSLCPL